MNRAWILAIVGLATLTGLFVALRPPEGAPVAPTAPATQARPDSATENAAAAIPAPRIVRLEVGDGRLTRGPKVIAAVQGETLTLEITSDRPDEFHLHGYDLRLDLEVDTPATLRIEADRSGRFGYELHSAHHELGVLEVQPR